MAQEEVEYIIIKDHCNFDPAVGALTVKYLWIVDPNMLQDNSAAALACQKKQEARQLKNGTHENYVK